MKQLLIFLLLTGAMLTTTPLSAQSGGDPAGRMVYTDTTGADSLRQLNMWPARSYSPGAYLFGRPGNRWLICFDGAGAFTQNQFRAVSNSDFALGFDLHVLHNLLPEGSVVDVYAGGAFEYLYFGGSSRSFSYDDPYPYNAIGNRVTTAVNNNAYSLMGIVRVERRIGPIVLFVEAAAGGRLWNGAEKVTVDRSMHSGGSLPYGVAFTPTSSSVSHTLDADGTGTYGYGGGYRAGSGSLRFEMKLMYMAGSYGKYIDNQSVRIDPYNGMVTYSTLSSTTDLFMLELGLSFNF